MWFFNSLQEWRESAEGGAAWNFIQIWETKKIMNNNAYIYPIISSSHYWLQPNIMGDLILYWRKVFYLLLHHLVIWTCRIFVCCFTFICWRDNVSLNSIWVLDVYKDFVTSVWKTITVQYSTYTDMMWKVEEVWTSSAHSQHWEFTL